MDSNTILAGVISAFFSTFIIWFAVKIFNKILLPWYKDIIYKGIDLEDKWVGQIEANHSKINFSIELIQKANQISGKCLSLKEYEDPGKSRENHSLQFDGYTRDGYVYGSFSNTDKKQVVFMLCLLRIGQAGNSLMGKLMFKEAFGEERITSTDFELRRQNTKKN